MYQERPFQKVRLSHTLTLLELTNSSTQANIGPISPGMQGFTDMAADITDYNPRCLRRDISPYIPKKWFTTANLLNVTVGAGSRTHRDFWTEIQGRYPDGFLGLHTSGHYTMGGDATDLYSSVNDPAFWLHHTMLDRIYWIWQTLHPAEANKVAGTLTLQNKPPTRDATIDDLLDLGVNGETLKIRNMLNTLGGSPLCYIYL
jgi:tyrosinase